MTTSFFKRLAGILALSVMLTVSAAHAQRVQQAEHIEHFDTAIAVQKDSSIIVTETIQYAFPSGEERHGIYRTIPLKDIYLSNIAVRNGSGAAQAFTASRSANTQTIKIGDPDILVEGLETYVLSYKVTGAIADLAAIDELYWNATGNEWNVPITYSRQTITIPASVPEESLKVSCYAGARGSTSPCGSTVAVTAAANGTQIDIIQSASLDARQGVTVAVGFPKGIVAHPTAWQKLLMAVQHSIATILAILFLVVGSAYSFLHWRKKGREPKGSGIVVAQYDVPEQLHPSEMAALIHKDTKNADISAELINLAVKGYLKIEKIETRAIFFKKGDYELTLLKDIDAVSDPLDLSLLQGMFGLAAMAGERTLLSDLKNSFFATIADAKKQVMSLLVSRNYFKKNPVTVRMVAIGIFVAGLFISLFIGGLAISFTGQWYVLPILLIAFVIIAVFTALSTPRTKKGVEVKEYSLGLKEYLQIAERDRINFHNAPEKKPELFEALLPYAMVLGVEKAWAKEFEGIYVTPPAWYVDHSMNGFNTALLVNSFSNFNTAAASSFSAPSSSASGGGGFSGGGSGGGGGGSW